MKKQFVLIVDILKQFTNMSLAIKNYDYSYSTLQQIRRWALTIEENPLKLQCKDYNIKSPDKCGTCIYCTLSVTPFAKWHEITKFPEFINHSDCDGGYINTKALGLVVHNQEAFRKELLWGDLKELQKEVQFLEKYEKYLNKSLVPAWSDFKRDVLSADKVVSFS